MLSDNGGPIYKKGAAGSNNFPLRGGKASNFEGGIRVNTFVSGGVVPTAMRGSKLEGMGTVWDWYSTFAFVGGADPTDHKAAAAGLPPIDSKNLWPYLSGEVPESPRTVLALGSSSCVITPDQPWSPHCVNEWGKSPSTTIVNGIIMWMNTSSLEGDVSTGLYKLLVGPIPMNGWQGPQFPNASTLLWAAEDSIHDCGKQGCLFRLDTDPNEHVDIAAADRGRVKAMMPVLMHFNETTFSPDRGPPNTTEACNIAMRRYGGFWGPWLA